MFLPDEFVREPALLVPGRKPVGPVEIDWSHPLAKGLEYAFVPTFNQIGRKIDLTGKRDLDYDSGGYDQTFNGVQIFEGREAHYIQGTAATLYRLKVDCSDLQNKPLTLACRLHLLATTDAGVVIRSSADNILAWRAAGTFDCRVGGTNYTNGGIFNLNQTYDYSISSGASGVSVTADGEEVVSGGAGAGATMGTLTFFDDDKSGGDANGYLFYVFIWSRELSKGELNAVRRNPYQFLKPAGGVW
jgi:hypothetical protein